MKRTKDSYISEKAFKVLGSSEKKVSLRERRSEYIRKAFQEQKKEERRQRSKGIYDVRERRREFLLCEKVFRLFCACGVKDLVLFEERNYRYLSVCG
eukprot:g58478.t1